LLLPTLRRYFEPMRTLRVIVPHEFVAAASDRFTDPWMTISSELDLVPEVRWFIRANEFGDGSKTGLRNWFIQQLIKLSIARVVDTPFYITLDADVLCCRPIAYGDLIQSGKSVAVVGERGNPAHTDWYLQAAKLLDMPRSERTHGVTPAVLSRDAVLSLFEYLEHRLRPNELRAEALLLSHVPWTEYSLYYTFLERSGLFDRYHVPELVRTYANNIWRNDDPDAWDPAGSFSADGQLFSVLQSHTVLAIDPIIEKIRGYFTTIGESSPV
jgi:hypothetical protein